MNHKYNINVGNMKYSFISLDDFMTKLNWCNSVLDKTISKRQKDIAEALDFLFYIADENNYEEIIENMEKWNVSYEEIRHLVSCIRLDLGANYYGGDFVEQSYKKAKFYYEKSYELGNAQAACNLGYIYLFDRTGEKSDQKAFELFSFAASYHNINGLYKLGDMYNMGLACEKDYSKAFYLYNEANRGLSRYDYSYPDIQKRLGDCYLYGNAVEKDLSKALKHYQNAQKAAQRMHERKELFMDILLAKINKQLNICKKEMGID